MSRKYQVKITAAAEKDIESIFDYIVRENRGAAIEWIDEIERQITSLERFPRRCALIPESAELGTDYRHLIHGHYRTIFRIERSSVVILRVVHSARLLDMEILKE